jgi:hypothetical protein
VIESWALFAAILVVWLACAVVASVIGPGRYSLRLLVLTLLFLGPLGVATALVLKAIEDYAPGAAEAPAQAPAAEPAPEKRVVQCRHCDAKLRIPSDAVKFTCARCRTVSPAS